MTVAVPSQYQSYVTAAAKATGLPEQVVAAQIDLESSWDPNAKSPAGAEGIAQFMPGTWKTYGSGSPYDAPAAFKAYAAYMRALLQQEGGDVRKALEAYNAGPGNLPAGAGYASTILTRAGASDSKVTVGSVGNAFNQLPGIATDNGGGLFSFPADIVNFFTKATDDLTQLGTWFGAFTRPSTWVRTGAGVFGFLFIILGIVCLGREAGRTTP